jgi:hypothetical protein
MPFYNGHEYEHIHDWSDRWLGQTVEFTLLGQKVRGKIVEAQDSMFFAGGKLLIAEFHDGQKHVKVGGSPWCFRRITEKE